MERLLESLFLGTRWLLMPLYLALLGAVLAIYVMVGRETVHLWEHILSGDESELLLLILGMLDLVLVANLLVMVAISSYESFISRIATDADESKPEWLGKMDAGQVKLKVALSIMMISAIHLLRAFMMDADRERLITLGGVHLVFVISTVALALVDRKPKQA